MARVKVRGRFYVIVTLFVAALVLLVYLLVSNRKTGTVTSGSVDMQFEASGVIVRDEVAVTTEKYDHVTFAVAEGATVTAQAPVATVFKLGYNDDMTQSLLAVQKQILDLQMQQLAGVADDQLDAINATIATKLQQMRLRAFGQAQDDLLTLELELKEQLAARHTYLKEKVQETQELTLLYEQEAAKVAQLDMYRGAILSAGAGVISFYFDGYEQVFNQQKLDMITPDLIKSALAGSTVTGGTTITETLLYRLVNDSHYYVAFLTAASSPQRLVAGESYDVTFGVDAGASRTGTALAPIVGADSVVNILEFSGPLGKLLSVRKTALTIKATAAGIVVPADAVAVSQEKKTGVTIDAAGEERWIEVDVLAINESSAVVRPITGETIAPGQKYVKP